MLWEKSSKSTAQVHLLLLAYLIVITITEAPVFLMCPLYNVLPYALYKQNKFQLLAFPLTDNHVHSKYSELSFLRHTALSTKWSIQEFFNTQIDNYTKIIIQGCQKVLNYLSPAIAAWFCHHLLMTACKKNGQQSSHPKNMKLVMIFTGCYCSYFWQSWWQLVGNGLPLNCFYPHLYQNIPLPKPICDIWHIRFSLDTSSSNFEASVWLFLNCTFLFSGDTFPASRTMSDVLQLTRICERTEH